MIRVIKPKSYIPGEMAHPLFAGARIIIQVYKAVYIYRHLLVYKPV